MKKSSITLQELEQALNQPEDWKRSAAMREFLNSEFGVEALPMLKRLLDDESLSVLFLAIECIGKLGPKALDAESSGPQKNSGLTVKLLTLGDHLWDYSGYKNCYGTSLNALVKIGYTNDTLLEHIRKNIDLECEDDFIDSLAALRAIGSPEALALLKRAAKSKLPKLNKTHTKKVLAILTKAGIKVEPSKASAKDWHIFHQIEITDGKLWAGDPQLANADDGVVVKVPAGTYVIECDGPPRRASSVSKLRVRLKDSQNVKRGRKVGETGTDSGTIGVCQIAIFEALYQVKGGPEAVQRAIDSQTGSFGIIKVPKLPGAIMPFVPTGSDGSGPVYALMSGKKRVGIELPFMDE